MEPNPYEAPLEKTKATGCVRLGAIAVFAMLVLLALACGALGYVAWLLQGLASRRSGVPVLGGGRMRGMIQILGDSWLAKIMARMIELICHLLSVFH
jgi:hypothetical protein